jgi:hypothetical protein
MARIVSYGGTKRMCTAVLVTQAQTLMAIDRSMQKSGSTNMSSRCEDGCVAAILQGPEGKGLRRTSCVQTRLSFLLCA